MSINYHQSYVNLRTFWYYMLQHYMIKFYNSLARKREILLSTKIEERYLLLISKKKSLTEQFIL